MATRRKPAEVPLRQIEFTNEDDDRRRIVPEFDPAEESFSQFRNKFGSENVIVKIYRRTPQGMQYCFQGIPSEIDEEMIRVYHAKQTYASEAGQYYARPFVNGEPRESFQIPIAPQVGASVPAAELHGGMAQGNPMLAMFQAQLDRLEQRLVSSAQYEREPLGSLADAMLKLQQLQPKQELGIDQIMKAIELGKTISSSGAPADDWKPLIVDLVKGSMPLLQGLAAAFIQKPTAPGITAPGEETAVQILSERQRMFAAIQYLKAKCLKGSDPGLFVDLIMDARDEPDNQKLIHAIVTQEFSGFIEIDPEIGKPPFLAFFKFVYDGLRSSVEIVNPVEPDTGGESGNESHPSSNGKTGKGGSKKR